MAVIRVPVPRTPKSAYNPDRKAGTLITNQVAHLEWATRPAGERAAGEHLAALPETEGEAAERIQQLMEKLHGETVGRAPVVAAAKMGPSRLNRAPKRAAAVRQRTSARRRTRKAR